MTLTKNFPGYSRLTAAALVTEICRRADRLMVQRIARRERMAMHYAAKAGYPKANGYTFHCLHNWRIGNGPEAGNEFAHKAVAAWFNRFQGTSDFTSRVYRLACAKYL